MEGKVSCRTGIVSGSSRVLTNGVCKYIVISVFLSLCVTDNENKSEWYIVKGKGRGIGGIVSYRFYTKVLQKTFKKYDIYKEKSSKESY